MDAPSRFDQDKGPKAIVFRFVGGARGGEIMRSDRPGEEEVTTFWALTWSGTVGRRFDVSSANHAVYQRYQVVSKYEINNEIHIACAYVGDNQSAK